MAKITVRYLTTRSGAAGAPVRYFWQPWARLQKQGWKPRRVPDNWQDIADPTALEAAAIAAAQALNAELDAWRDNGARQSQAPAPAIAASPSARIIRNLVEAYKKGAEFKKLAATTQRTYGQSLAILEDWAGDAPIATLTPPRFRRWYVPNYAIAPARANNMIRTAGAMFKWARLEGGWGVKDNPTAELGLQGLAPSGHVWPREAVTDFVAVADALGFHGVGTAVLIDEWMAQRQADILKLPRNLLAPTGQVIRQGKTLAVIKLPIAAVPLLVARIEGELARQANSGIASTRLIVNDETGQPYQTDTFRHHFAIVRAALAKRTPSYTTDYVIAGTDPGADDAFTLPTSDLQFMHLRHTGITRLAEAGCSVPQIAAISGHTKKSVEQMLERYLIRTGALARQAFAKRLEAETAPPSTWAQEDGEGREQA